MYYNMELRRFHGQIFEWAELDEGVFRIINVWFDSDGYFNFEGRQIIIQSMLPSKLSMQYAYVKLIYHHYSTCSTMGLDTLTPRDNVYQAPTTTRPSNSLVAKWLVVMVTSLLVIGSAILCKVCIPVSRDMHIEQMNRSSLYHISGT